MDKKQGAAEDCVDLYIAKYGFNRHQISPMQSEGGLGGWRPGAPGSGGDPFFFWWPLFFFCFFVLFFFFVFFFLLFFSKKNEKKNKKKKQKKEQKKKTKKKKQKKNTAQKFRQTAHPKKKHPPETSTDCPSKNSGLVGLAKRTPFLAVSCNRHSLSIVFLVVFFLFFFF